MVVDVVGGGAVHVVGGVVGGDTAHVAIQRS